jgi:hypothetical protein
MDHKGALLRLAIPMIALKVWFAILLLRFAPTRDTLVWIAATHWTLILVIGVMVGPCIALFRLLRARARRAHFRRAEFTADAQCSALWETVSRLEGDG